MSEPTRTSAAKRAKLATALKRNMARRKAAGDQSNNVRDSSPRSALRREPLAAGGQRSVGDEESPSINGKAS